MIHLNQRAPAMPTAEPASMLVCRFVADVLEHTIALNDEATRQRVVQAFVEELRPWMPPVASPLRAYAPLFAILELDENSGQVSVAFTPEGLTCFRGWLRRQGLDPVLSTS
jgi:hypothetical protein